MSIGELADRAGLTRRAIRFYVQQGLLPAPLGLGRGGHYDQQHLQQLLKIQELQAAGHSLLAVGQILRGQAAGPPAPVRPSARQTSLTAELWTRLEVMEGVELHVDMGRRQPAVEELLAAKQALQAIFGRQPQDLSESR